MYCTKCGVQLEGTARFCSQCGEATGLAAKPQAYRALTRPLVGRKIAGVCVGLARYWGLDPVLVRILFVALALFPALPAIIPYIVCWVIMPSEEASALAATSQGPVPHEA
ncbi:MAG: PspC domain-containing protein [Bryobacteraceae bacterium]|nr:PspC domain-containing protein [Bryobacteraceae bacterium]